MPSSSSTLNAQKLYCVANFWANRMALFCVVKNVTSSSPALLVTVHMLQDDGWGFPLYSKKTTSREFPRAHGSCRDPTIGVQAKENTMSQKRKRADSDDPAPRRGKDDDKIINCQPLIAETAASPCPLPRRHAKRAPVVASAS